MDFLFTALGGAVGAVGRYAVSLIPNRFDFPLLTFITNIIGALLIGFIAGAAEKYSLPKNCVIFWKTGVCGGFTTFSAFSLESFSLIENKEYFLSAAYMILSVICCLGGIYLGKKLAAIL